MNATFLNHSYPGQAPQTTREFKMLQNEIMGPGKLRCNIDWYKVERLSCSLFRLNGMDLQTLCWFTLCEAHIKGLNGLCDGLEKMITLMQHNWSTLWPASLPERLIALSWLYGQLQHYLTDVQPVASDLIEIYRLEKILVVTEETLGVQALKHLSQLSRLKVQVNRLIHSLEQNAALADAIKNGTNEDAVTSAHFPSLRNLLRYSCGFLAGLSVMVAFSGTGWVNDPVTSFRSALFWQGAPNVVPQPENEVEKRRGQNAFLCDRLPESEEDDAACAVGLTRDRG
ncbi:type VI secretion system ImpA family N-terminal domain-containing protein [Erwinia oleae]|uniref:type VI secretion system ImpA family N-terminal domain-containing protein n=1 Tax=Erwinia oleae TaxID=796334 RepID=UPI00068989F4|nr:type VI secretion system ImpA family N-terminal domain-containing protein [Erwinia oleae]